MTARQINFALQVAAIALSAVAALCLLIGLILPLETSRSSASAGHSTGPEVTMPGSLPPLDKFAGIWANPLRRPLGDVALNDAGPPPQTTAPSAATAAPVPFSLVGTVGDSLAMIKSADGSVVVRGVGEEIDGAQILAVRPAQIDVRYQGQTVTVAKPSDEIDDSTIIGSAPDPAPADSAMAIQHP